MGPLGRLEVGAMRRFTLWETAVAFATGLIGGALALLAARLLGL